MSALGSLMGLGGSLFGGSGLAKPAGPTTANDSGLKVQNTPVTVIAGNSGTDLAAILAGVANLSMIQNEPAEVALAKGVPGAVGAAAASSGLSGLLKSPVVWIIGAGLLWYWHRRKS